MENRSAGIRVLRIKQLQERIGMSRSAIYDRLNPSSPRYDASFPRPVKIGRVAVGWLERSVEAWIEERFAKAA